MEAQDDLFNTKIINIVEEKWDRHYNDIVQQTYIYLVYILLLTLHLALNLKGNFVVLLIFIMQLRFFIFEELNELIKGPRDYFSQFENWLDFLSGTAVIIYFVRLFLFPEKDPEYFMLYFGVLLGYQKLLTQMQVFNQKMRTNIIMF